MADNRIRGLERRTEEPVGAGKVDDTLITDSDSLIATVRSYRPGDTVTITFTRDGDEQTVKVTLESDAELTNG